MWVADNIWEERENGRVHYWPGLHPLDVNEGIVQNAESMGIRIIRKAQLKNVSTRLLKRDFLIKVHHWGNGNTHPTDEPPASFHDMLRESQRHFTKPTYGNSQTGRQANFEITMDPNSNILSTSPYRFSPLGEDELRR